MTDAPDAMAAKSILNADGTCDLCLRLGSNEREDEKQHHDLIRVLEAEVAALRAGGDIIAAAGDAALARAEKAEAALESYMGAVTERDAEIDALKARLAVLERHHDGGRPSKCDECDSDTPTPPVSPKSREVVRAPPEARHPAHSRRRSPETEDECGT